MSYLEDASGIFVPANPVAHRDDEYEESGFDSLKDMQTRHFWYTGRHRFLLQSVKSQLPSGGGRAGIDLGGGCGGWVRYLADRAPKLFAEMALADSSRVALAEAASFIPEDTARYQVDLMNLEWSSRWDAAFLLDVIEHLPDDLGAMKQVHAALRPGGLAFVTVPALDAFWSYNDDLSHHKRRYDRAGFANLAEAAGLELVDARYFMFFLSPLYWLSRRNVDTKSMTETRLLEIQKDAHRVPSTLVNGGLAAVFAAETPLGHWVRFPWGTSLLGVFRRPR